MAKSGTQFVVNANFIDQLTCTLRSIKGTEEMGQAFRYVITFYEDKASSEVKPADAIAQNVLVQVKKEGKTRNFHGIATAFQYKGIADGHRVYELEVRPSFWLLTQQFDCRIFQNKTAIEIVEEVLKNGSTLVTYEKKVAHTPPKLDYCTQYRESSYDFVCRLLEKEGISFYFQHEAGKHVMVLVDKDRLTDLENDNELNFRPPGQAMAGEVHISRLRSSHHLRSTKTELTDFDFEAPKSDLTSKTSRTAIHSSHNSFERYDYPGKYVKTDDGNNYAKFELNEVGQECEQFDAFGNSVFLNTGQCFKLADHPGTGDPKVDYLIIRSEFEIESGEIEQFGSAQNRIEFKMKVVKKTTGYLTPSRTPKPIVQGPQTAIVVGKKGEEIWTDKYGRIKVQFHWDRLGKSDENSSCWIRVAQGWAGKNWGMIYIPRIGQEVIVEFLEGDPDRPIVTGSLYNGENGVPYKLPDNQTQSGVLTRSTKQGDTKTFNELRFEDKKGSEEIYFHAEKNFNRVVENDDTLKVGFDKKDKGNQTVEIYNDQTLNIEKGNRTETIKTGNDTLTIEKGDRTATIKQGNETLTIEKGDATIKASSGKITIEAGTEITLKVGGSSITIKSSEISLKSTTIKIEGSTKTEVKAATVDVNGSGTCKIAGGMVKIN